MLACACRERPILPKGVLEQYCELHRDLLHRLTLASWLCDHAVEGELMKMPANMQKPTCSDRRYLLAIQRGQMLRTAARRTSDDYRMG